MPSSACSRRGGGEPGAARGGPLLVLRPLVRDPGRPPRFFFNDTATTEIYTLSLHDALPILYATRPGIERPSPRRSRSTPVTSAKAVGQRNVVTASSRRTSGSSTDGAPRA